MSDLWTCIDCEAIVNLDKHGRCAVCNSDAVVRRLIDHCALLARLWPEYDNELEELETLWRRK